MRLIDADAIPWFVEGIGEIPVITKEEIDEMPTIEAEPVRHARWIKMSDADGVFYGCSECGEWHKETSDYCPNCGAKMGTLRDKKVRKETNNATD